MAADPKAAPLADELKEFALTLDASGFPKNFFCALCNRLAFDPYKLLCCNKAICPTCQSTLEFPTTCPSCEHTPLETDSCTPNKSLRNTMRVWLQKQKKKEEAKAVSQAATPAPSEVQPTGDAAEKSAEGLEGAPKSEDAPADEVVAAADDAGQALLRAGSTASQPNEDSASLENKERPHEVDHAAQDGQAAESASQVDGSNNAQNMDGYGAGMYGNHNMMNPNGMPGQSGYGISPNQGNFNGMGINGMAAMNGMPMMNRGWNLNPMDYNMSNMNGMSAVSNGMSAMSNGMSAMSNGMYGGYNGNMGIGMNDMSAMNLNYGGRYGNGWSGMGSGGYGSYNGYNSVGGYNQSGSYPEMMPQSNFPHNRFRNGGAYTQPRTNRNGSFGSYGPGYGFQRNGNSRPGSRSGPPYNRDGESPVGTASAAPDAKVEDQQATQAEGEQVEASTEPTLEGKDDTNPPESMSPNAQAEGESFDHATKGLDDLTHTENGTNDVSAALNPIQTIESVETEAQGYDQLATDDGMHYDPEMNHFAQQSYMSGDYDQNMSYHHNNFGHRGGFNGAYGAATVLTGEPEPRGLGVEGAPTGPRAMREGRPNTGFSSRANNARYGPPSGVSPAQPAPSASPTRRLRSRSPQRDESLRVKERSPERSRSQSRDRDEARDDYREDQREDRGRSKTPETEDEYERRKERRHHRSSRYDDREGKDQRVDYDDRYDREDRGDRTRSASAESKHRSRRDKEKHRSSRSHRDRSREHRRRHRSRSPIQEDKYEDEDSYVNGTEESTSRRKSRSDKDKHRDRDKRDRKERDYDRDYDYEREKDRSRDKDKERRRRREREAEDDEREYEDEKYRSRRSRKERDRERDRDRDYEKEPSSATSNRPISPPLNAPTGPSADNFSIRGVSKAQKAVKGMPPPQPPTGPRAFQPPKGPAADRDREHGRKGSVSSSIQSTPTTPIPQDHYAAEREKNARERDRLDRDNRDTSVKNIHSRTTHQHGSRPSLSSKRSRDEFESSASATPREPEIKGAPTGPSMHRDKRRKSGGDGDANDIASKLTQGLRKRAGAARRGGVKTEGDAERELERVERERDGRRW